MKNNEFISSTIRHVLTAGAGYVAAKGDIAGAGDGDVQEVVGAVMLLGGLFWSWIEKKLKKKKAAKPAAAPVK